MTYLGYNRESVLVDIKNLTGIEFGKSLIKIRKECCKTKEEKELFDAILSNYDLSKKEIRELIASKGTDNKEFVEKLQRSLKANKNDSMEVLARKIEKQCKSKSTENKKLQKTTKIDFLYELIVNDNVKKICEKLPRIVLFLDNAKAHGIDLVKDIAKTLNIYLLYIPRYSPELAPVEFVFKIIKDNLKNNKLKTDQQLVEKSHEIFNEKCQSDNIYMWFVKRYIPQLL